MGWKLYGAVLSVTGIAALAGCASEPTGASAPSFLTAAVVGSKHAQYDGTGSFLIRSAGTAGARFSLYSQGAGASTDQGFAFQAMEAPTPGEFPIGEMDQNGQIDPDRYHVNYWYDQGNTRTIFKAQSGTVRISESTERRVKGSFQLTATLLYKCTLTPSLAGQLMECKPAQEEGSVEITGSFDAGALGGDKPGLIPPP